MTKIWNLFTREDLADNINEGFIREQSHPVYPYIRILNYTEAAQFSRSWNDVTRICRGLIYDSVSGEVLARPFQKIHNWDEAEAPRITDNAPLYAWSNKEDGSLGIVYPLPDATLAVATRGSFASEQAVHATALLRDSPDYKDMYNEFDELVGLGFTPLVEIIYPENRIVLDYGDDDKLVPIGSIYKDTGAYIPATVGETRTFDDIRMDLSRPNSEGWVVWLSEYKAVKVKQADYVELHRIVTGLNRKSIWRAIGDGTFDENVAQMPDELHAWAVGVRDELETSYTNLVKHGNRMYTGAGADAGTQKDFALNVLQQVPRPMQGIVFGIRSGRPLRDMIWKMLEPKGNDK